MDFPDRSTPSSVTTDRFRFDEAVGLIHRLEKPDSPSEGLFSAIGMVVTDAILDHDDQTLGEILDGCKRVSAVRLVSNGDWPPEAAGRLLGLIDIIGWATRRVLPLTVRQGVAPGTHAYRFLRALVDDPGCTGKQLAAHLRVDATEISRVGSKLETSGLVRKVRVGREKRWSITPRGVTALNLTEQLSSRPGEMPRRRVDSSGAPENGL